MRGRSPGRLCALAVALALAVVTVFSLRAFAQPPPSTDINDKVSSLEREVAVLRESIDGLSNLVNVTLAFVGLFFALTAGVSAIGYFRAESRATESHALSKESHSLSKESHALSVAGERAAQERADAIHTAFLASSKDTLELVNATLELARQASESASKSIEREASERLKQLDQQARLLVARVPDEDVHELASNPTLRSEVTRLAQKIDGFETNRLLIPETLQLTPYALFIRGMDFHLVQNFEESLESWQRVVAQEETSDLRVLQSFSWYWIGREQDNLAEFARAERSFANARRNASPLMDLELQRNIIEAQFFNKSSTRAADLVEPLESLLGKVAVGVDIDRMRAERVRGKVLTTLGNIATEAGDECPDSVGKTEYYKRALSAFTQAGDQDKWAIFGKAEALHRLGRGDEAFPIYRKARRLAADEYHKRTEPRTKTAARTVELICCVRVPEFWEEAPMAKENVIDELAHVHDRLTVFSEFQRRNVRKTDFRAGLDEFMREFEQRRS